MQPSSVPVALADMPRALWAVASTTYTSSVKQLGPEWPLACRFGYAEPLDPAQHVSLLHYLLERPTLELVRLHHLDRPDVMPPVHLSTSVRQTYAGNAAQIFEVLLRDPRQNHQAIREIKEVTRPECPYTALVVMHDGKLSGNTGLVWVAVRDELDSATRDRLTGSLRDIRSFHSVTPRGRSTFELRVDYRFVRQPKQLVSPLIEAGIYPDFRAVTGNMTYEQAINQRSGL